jgi:hypothetical protein
MKERLENHFPKEWTGIANLTNTVLTIEYLQIKNVHTPLSGMMNTLPGRCEAKRAFMALFARRHLFASSLSA